MLRLPLRSSNSQDRSPIQFIKRLLSTFSCILGLLLFATAGNCAPYHPRVVSDGRTIVINGEAAITVDGAAGRLRASRAAELLRASGTRAVGLQKISRRKWSLSTEDGTLLLLVTRADSRAAGAATVSALAHTWSARIDQLLALPAVSLAIKQRPMIVPTGSFRSIAVSGIALPGQITAVSLTGDVTSSKYDSSSRTLTIGGLKPGFATVSVSARDDEGGESNENVAVLVENRAGVIDSQAEASVTGSPAACNLMIQAARTAVYRSVTLDPNAYLEIVKQPDCAKTLAAGNSTTVTMTVRAAGSNLIPVEQKVSVQIINNRAFPPASAQTLFYSNNPETVKRPQPLFDALIPALNSPVRLVFHHQDCSGSPMTMRVELTNRGQAAATIRLLRGLSGAGQDPVNAGAHAGADFLFQWQTNSSELISIPAQSRLELYKIRTGPGDVASGVFEITQTSGAQHSLALHIAAEPYSSADVTGLSSLVDVQDPEMAAMAILPLTSAYQASLAAQTASDQIYASPSVSVSASYAVGGPWMHLVIGTDSPLARLAGNGSSLAGNYGVIYNAAINLTNPTTTKRQIEILFSSDAGEASGVFTINGGTTTLVSNLLPPNEQEITRVTLAPGATQSVQLQTMPLSGSAYPAAITAHAL